MKTIAAYPGCFTPPTYGHFQIAKKAAEIFPEITIICSTNEEKKQSRWFSEETCKSLWRHYALPENVHVKTFTEFSQEQNDFKKIIMIRGIRDENDMENEKRVMKLNKETFGIDKIFYILAEKEFAGISASRAREAAKQCDLKTLAECACPAIVTLLLEKALRLKNLFMVVGKPGSGKSTFVGMLSKLDSANIHINTDVFSRNIKPMLQEKFGTGTDLVSVAIEHEKEMTDFVAPIWIGLLAQALQEAPENSNVFLEIPYGLKPGKALYRYVGHKIIHVGCEKPAENHRRIIGRGTRHHTRFIDEIPDLEQSMLIARENGLDMIAIDSSGDIGKLWKTADDLSKTINQGEEKHDERTI